MCAVTGPSSANRTDARWDVWGTDLGHMFEHNGREYMAFGDTYGRNRKHPRSNALALLAPENDPNTGLTIESMETDASGRARQIIPNRLLHFEVTVIPTYGVSVGDRMYLHYMSVRRWLQPGRWQLNHSGLAYSDDDGRTWRRAGGRRPGNSAFSQVAFVKANGFVYLFGIPAGRFGALKLARVQEDALLSPRLYEYWTGDVWSNDGEKAATTLVPAPVGELSVAWNSYYSRWLMMYLDERTASIVLRTADVLTGPWSEERTVVTAEHYPQLYAPYITPRWNDGPEVYFTMSLFGSYNVFLMRTRLGQHAFERPSGES